MKYRFTAEARDDLRHAQDFYEFHREGLGGEFAVEVGVAIAKLLDGPRRWAEIRPAVRKYRLRRFPYAIYYRLPTGGLIEIVAVFDLRRNPGSGRHGLP
jgi:plasmid stabilization system protein ParE